MDFQILIIIACVFLASLFSLLFINKFFRRKTFEEIVAEKKAMTEKIYGPAKAAKKQARSSKLPSKKELKKEKRQRQQKKSEDNTTEVDDSDAQSENPSIEDIPEETQQQQQQHAVSNKKAAQPVVHVEFAAPEAEIVDSDNGSNVGQRRSSADSNNQKTTNKSNKQRKNANTKSVGILSNKNEHVVVKEMSPAIEEKQPALNHFETKHPKDAVELKKQEGQENKKPKDQRKTNKPKKETPSEPTGAVEIISVSKDLKLSEEKPVRTGSPKNQSNKLKQQNKKKNDKDNIGLDKINENDTIGVSLLMNLFGRAELNRSEIQILIDYLLNKQQDMPASHSEWSDDIVQKLKKQLEEKEKALQDEQESSLGLQAKLRDMRTEINAERAQMNATVKGYFEEIQAKKSEIAALTQELQNTQDKHVMERAQAQKKHTLEKQAASQDLLLQLQRENERNAVLQAELAHKEQAISELKAELVHKDQCVNDLKCLVNASHQGVEDAKQKTSEIIQTQVNKIHVLEQKLDEAEVVINKQRYELEKAKTTEGEHESSKVELRNLQNALDSKQSELDMALNELGDKQQEIDTLSLANKELSEEIGGINSKAEEKNKQQNDLQHTLDVLQTALKEKDKKISEYETSVKQLTSKEDELMKQIQEQKEKNNQQQQHHALLLSQEQQKVNTIKPDPAGNQKQIRDILERLYPDAVAANAGSALSLSFDQWVEQVLATHVKQSISKNSATTATNTTSTNTTNSNSSSNHSSHNHNNLNNSEDTKNISDSIINSSSVSTSTSTSSSGISDVESASSAADKAEILKLQSQNAQLRANSEELTKLVTKTGNTLLELEARAREQEENWRSIVRSKEEEINLLKHSNGEKQDI